MADTCSGIYFWSGVSSPLSLPPPLPRPPLVPRGCPRETLSPGTRSFSPIEFNGYPRRLIYWMRSFAPPARNNCNLQRHWTVAHRCRPSFECSPRCFYPRPRPRPRSPRFAYVRGNSFHVHAARTSTAFRGYGVQEGREAEGEGKGTKIDRTIHREIQRTALTMRWTTVFRPVLRQGHRQRSLVYRRNGSISSSWCSDCFHERTVIWKFQEIGKNYNKI